MPKIPQQVNSTLTWHSQIGDHRAKGVASVQFMPRRFPVVNG